MPVEVTVSGSVQKNWGVIIRNHLRIHASVNAQKISVATRLLLTICAMEFVVKTLR